MSQSVIGTEIEGGYFLALFPFVFALKSTFNWYQRFKKMTLFA